MYLRISRPVLLPIAHYKNWGEALNNVSLPKTKISFGFVSVHINMVKSRLAFGFCILFEIFLRHTLFLTL